ncbi:opsin family protein [Cyberlindnera jadinii NRRL Y-1542]|uniref:Family A G protein-coupled receptor-like protein n=1 Tax=Cyberlindnera jadinii (strain ATCC 18201 / CBS 1600 / BCRC 20928 / JCM 3617 / NBRC 0987 / NRRL Y-1542) TaxID=983966 RepID=A0A1E4RUH0_CYBJN|nr:family A G protein-coupled receptor-like protein [Cyberlindnera jadinii NRRL Y-1542]ODV70851.1 family A G protein-coupled receptor-like protein [Cyberlindnera jadinii NRRL Y-1542]
MPSINEIQLIKRGGNQAIEINPPTGVDFHLTSSGSDWLWAAFCVFILYSLIMHVLMFRKPVKERIFYYTSVVPAWIMAIGYFTWASNLGWTPIQAEFNHVTVDDQETHPGYRQIFYAKFIAWFLAFPFHTIALGLLSNTPGVQTAYNIFFTDISILGYLFGSLVKSTYKWGYFTFAVASTFATAINLFTTSRRSALEVGKDCHFYFTLYASGFVFIWLVYPIAWALADGGNVIQPDSDAVFYGVLDVITFVFIPAVFFFFIYDFNLERIGLNKPEFQFVANKEISTVSGRTSGETVQHSASTTPAPAPAASP